MNEILLYILGAILGLVSVGLWKSRMQILDLRLTNTDLSRANQSLKDQIEQWSQMESRFKGLAASTLEASQKHFLEMALSNFNGQAELQKKEYENRTQELGHLLKPVSETISLVQKQLSEIERDRQKAFNAIDTELKRVAELSGTLGRETASLKDALKRPHVRGRWGEVQLRNCIELAGMSEYADVKFQDVHSDNDGGIHIPDMIVRMPGGRQVIVDAKTPIDAFMNSLEAQTEEARVAEMARHGRHVKDHVRKLSSKSYTEALKESADFTVLFLPNESFLYAALEQEPDLMEYALQRKILIATPPTLIGLLKVIRYGWNEERLAENAQKISDIGRELHKRLRDFVESYDKVGKFLDRAKEEFEKGRTRLNSRVLVQAQRFESLGVRSGKSLAEGIIEETNPSSENAGSLQVEAPEPPDAPSA